VEYDARLKGGSNGEFVKAYSARWSSAPDASAAAGYAAASVLAAGVRLAGSFESGKLRTALGALDTDTVLGRYRVNPADGSQAGIRPAVVQVVEGRAEIVWPAESRTAEPRIACR
jgi:ABC-type branched-subunit amino acid transport system substrate-binding protein